MGSLLQHRARKLRSKSLQPVVNSRPASFVCLASLSDPCVCIIDIVPGYRDGASSPVKRLPFASLLTSFLVNACVISGREIGLPDLFLTAGFGAHCPSGPIATRKTNSLVVSGLGGKPLDYHFAERCCGAVGGSVRGGARDPRPISKWDVLWKLCPGHAPALWRFATTPPFLDPLRPRALWPPRPCPCHYHRYLLLYYYYYSTCRSSSRWMQEQQQQRQQQPR